MAKPSPARRAESPHPLAGQHALVTGGGTGIGAAIARELAHLGAMLTLVGRRAKPLAETCEALAAEFGAGCAHQLADVTDPEMVARALLAAADHSGPIHILVNNAGAAESAPFLKTDLALFERMLSVNLRSAFLCSQAALPTMLRAGSGRIVNIASTAGLTGYAYVAAYCAAKHGLVGLTRALAREHARSGITINAVCPGYTETALFAAAVDTIVAKTQRNREEAESQLIAGNPMGRIIQPDEVAATVGWLCMPGAGAVTGQAIVVAGGEIMA
ncbi:MAG: SDR family NAD(P)-dependent oxidoreductase [Proteobacteria bacterium]|nr:SDR family NAD(P)-dependent oxidoreductase [Pseudomonadota bacterium]